MRGRWDLIGTIVGYIVLGLSIAAPVGPINVEMINRGMRYGFWPAFLVGCGGMTSDILLMALMFVGLSNVLLIGWVNVVLLILGCFVLLHSGCVNLLNAQQEPLDVTRDSHHRKALLTSYATGLTIAATNPMNLLFWLSIYGSVLSDVLLSNEPGRSFLLSSLVFVGIGLWNLHVALSIHFGRRIMNRFVMRSIRVVASCVLLYYGLKFGVQACNEMGMLF